MAQLFANNARSRLASDLAAAATSLTVLTGEGALFPALTAGLDHFLVTLENAAGQREVVRVTNRAADTFTIERAVESVGSETATAHSFSSQDLVELRLTAGFIDAIKRGSIVYVIDGGGSAISTGIKGFMEIPFSGSIESVRLFADVAGSIAIDIYKDTYANYDPTVDQSADSIVGSLPPTISGTFKGELSAAQLLAGGWNQLFEAGDILYFAVTSISTITRCTVSITVDRN